MTLLPVAAVAVSLKPGGTVVAVCVGIAVAVAVIPLIVELRVMFLGISTLISLKNSNHNVVLNIVGMKLRCKR